MMQCLYGAHVNNKLQWRVPWHPVAEQQGEALLRELKSELSKRHVLHGIAVRAVGQRQDCDDVVFELLDGSGRFAVVHLTFARHPEPDPRWPETTLFENWADFERQTQSDAAEWAN